MDKYAFMQGYIEKNAVGPAVIAAPILTGLGVAETIRGGRKAYQEFKDKEPKKAWKDVGLSALGLAGAIGGTAWTISSLGRAAKLARIAARAKRLGKPTEASQILRYAQRLREATLKNSRRRQLISAAKGLRSSNKVRRFRALVQYASLVPAAERSKYIEQAQSILPKLYRHQLTSEDLKNLAGLKIYTPFQKITDPIKDVAKSIVPSSAKKLGEGVVDVLEDITTAPWILAGKTFPETVGRLGRGKASPMKWEHGKTKSRKLMGTPLERRIVSSSGTPKAPIGSALAISMVPGAGLGLLPLRKDKEESAEA